MKDEQFRHARRSGVRDHATGLCLQLLPTTPGLLGDSTMDDGRQSDFSFAKLGARRLGMRELLADAIADLPERERLVFTLYYYEGLETSEIALVLEETLFAVVQLHVSTLGRLKARLADPSGN